MKKVVIKAAIIVLRLLYTILKIFPRDRRILLLSRQSNSPTLDFILLRDQLQKDLPEYKIVLLTKRLDGGLFAKLGYAFHMLCQLYHLARAQAVVLDSYCIAVSVLKHRKGLFVLQMWHAIGSMKKFGYAMIGKEEGSSREIAEVMRMHKNYDLCAISSLSFLKDYLEGFGISADHVVEIPLPRADLLTDPDFRERRRRELLEKYPVLAERKNILYCPTFRKEDSAVEDAVNRLAEVFDPREYNFIAAMHPLCPGYSFADNVLRFRESTFDLLFAADHVISDYSSVIYEAGLLGLPIYAYAYDWADYSTKREINFDIEHDFPGPFTADPSEILRAVRGSYDYAALDRFISENITMPVGSSCRESLSSLIRSRLQ